MRFLQLSSRFVPSAMAGYSTYDRATSAPAISPVFVTKADCDSYTETRNAQGQITGGTHATLCPVPGCFMTGRPSYELFRSTVFAPVKAAPLATTTAPATQSEQ